ncbi:MAG: glutamate--tRNA ligase family protein, partial [Actinomycetota bacterium]|nr:glutamate--tRNA ligase family protein [Actinomycetota bacterium]
HQHGQLTDLANLGVEWDGDIEHQSDRFDLYHHCLERLVEQGQTYECFCSRREVRDAAIAAHGPTSHYPGTCRDLTSAQHADHRRAGRPAAIRFRGDDHPIGFDDRIAGPSSTLIDDVVLRRNDGTPAYNLAVVADDADQGIEEVVRGDDLLPSTPAQIAVGRALGFTDRAYAHVPLAYGPSGDRLAKRDGAVTLDDLEALGVSAETVTRQILESIFGPEAPRNLSEAASAFSPDDIEWAPWNLTAHQVAAIDRR